MKLRHLTFYVLLLAGVFVVGKLIKTLTIGFGDPPETAWDYSVIILITVLIISACYFIAQRSGLTGVGGFQKGNSANYWMLLLPVLFPGLLFFKLKNYHCIDLSLFYFIYLVSVVLMATVEEVLFRGIIFGHLQKNYPERSVHFHCFVSAALFSVMHLINLQYSLPGSVIMQLVTSFMMGLFFAALMLRIRNVWLLGMTHGVLNIMTSNICNEVLDTPPEPGSIVEGNGLAGALIFLLLLSPVWIIYILLVRSYRNNPSGNMISKTTK